jgi:hypothetical protein
MTPPKTTALADVAEPDGSIAGIYNWSKQGGYIYFKPGSFDNAFQLDGWFSIDELLAIVEWMRAHDWTAAQED